MPHELSPDHAAVLHVLTAPHIARRTAPYLAADDPDFARLGIECETMSSGEELLVRIARDLWTAERTVGLTDVARKLDTGSFARVLQALRIARGSYLPGSAHRLAADTEENDLAA